MGATLDAPVKLSVIIPARNEAHDLEHSLRSVLGQEGVQMEVFVVNDHSTDRTGAIADDAARSDPRVRVLHDPPLPAGWLGKQNAMQQAAARATGDLLLFSDADIIHHPRCFTAGIRELQQNGYDFISLTPQLILGTFWDNVLAPAFAGWFIENITPRLEDPGAPDALAAGAFLLVKTAVFRDLGGFEAIKGEMLDDVELARLLKRRGFRVGIRLAPALMRVQFYKTNHDAFWGVTKNILSIVQGRRWLSGPLMVLGLPLMLVPALYFWTPLVAACLGIVHQNTALLLAGLATYAAQYAMVWPARRLFPFRPLKLLFLPLVVFPLFCCYARALYYRWRHGAVFWRGRAVKVAKNSV